MNRYDPVKVLGEKSIMWESPPTIFSTRGEVLPVKEWTNTLSLFRLEIGGCSPSQRGQQLGAPKPVTAIFNVSL